MQRLILAVLCWVPVVAVGQTLGEPLVGTRKVVNNGPGNQSDPHVSGSLVAYTNETQGMSEIRYHDLSTSQDLAIPNGGAYDFVADISGDTVVFTRVLSSSNSIFTYNVATQGPAVEVAPQPSSNRRGAVVGNGTVVWQDFSYPTPSSQPEIAAFDLNTQTLVRLTNDNLLDRTPAVSTDGSVIVWAKCASGNSGCDVWQAVSVPGPDGFQMMALTGSEGEESQPDSNGQTAVYASTRTDASGVTDRDIFWKPVGGGTEYRLALPGLDANPSISGTLIAFERQDPSAPTANYDIMLFDLKTQTLYRLTATPQSENLNDISVGADGLVRVVWSLPENEFDVHSFIFQLPGNPGCEEPAPETAEEACNNPGDRPLLASVNMSRAAGEPPEVGRSLEGPGEAVVCVDNGFGGSRATAGWVEINGQTVVDPSAFQQDVELIARTVEIEDTTSMSVRIAGKPLDSAFRVRVYGPHIACDGGFRGTEIIAGESVTPREWEPAASPAPELEEARTAFGCGMSGGSMAWVGTLLLAALLWSHRSVRAPARARARRSKR
jgi:Tol biopolymer transport system component